MKVFVELNDRVKEIDADSVSQLRVAIVKALNIDITKYDMCFADKAIDDGFALQPELLIRVVSKDAAAQKASARAGDWKALLALAASADNLLIKTLRYAVDNSDYVIDCAKRLLAQRGLETTFGRMSTDEVKEYLHELIYQSLEDGEECGEDEEFEERSEEDPAPEAADEDLEKK